MRSTLVENALVGIEAWGLEIIGARSHTISIYHVVAAAICLELCNYAAWLLYTIIIIVIMVLHYFSIVCQQRSTRGQRKKVFKNWRANDFFLFRMKQGAKVTFSSSTLALD